MTLRDAHAAAGARDVGDLDAARDTGGNQRLLHRTRGLVPSAAGCCGSHQLEFERLGERRSGRRKRQRDECTEQARNKRGHWFPPVQAGADDLPHRVV